MEPLPVVAIVGRPNVGKSSLLNALVQKRVSIVQDMPGVTRDRISYPMPIDSGPPSRPDPRFIELVDTGGYGFDDPDLAEHIKHQIEIAMSMANLVLFVVDCQDGLTTADEQIAAMLRKKSIKTVLIANKADGPKADVALAEFARLGLDTPIGISALHGRNIEDVLVAIKKNLDLKKAPKTIPSPQMHIAIVGKRNAGKSTLVNTIDQLYQGSGDRVIVSEIPGTTRDSVDVRFEKDGQSLIVIDTAGVRKKRQMVATDIEFYSFHRAQRSIRRADVVLMLIDGVEPISEPDRKLAQYIADEFKPVIFVINKWDLAREKIRTVRKDAKPEELHDSQMMEEYREYLDKELPFLDFAPIAFITAKEGRNVQGLLDLTQHLYNQANERLTTGRLNRAVQQILLERTPSSKFGKRVRVFYATQVSVAPPVIALFVNHPEFVDTAYQRFFVNRMRELLPYPEVPIKLLIRGRAGQTTKTEFLANDPGSPNRRAARAAKPRPTRAGKTRRRR
jgi:GTP-binding protein